MVISKLRKLANLVIWKLAILILTLLLVFVIGPIVLIFLAPIYTFRWILFKLAPVIRPDLGKMLTTRSTLYGVDDINGKSTANLVTVFVFKGVISLEKLRDNITTRIIDWKNEKGELSRPEMRQYVYQYLGFLFWKTDENYDIKNHVLPYGGGDGETEVDDEKLKEIQKEQLQRPHVQGRSPWMVLVIKNFKPKKPIELDMEPLDGPKSAIVVLSHHVLGDGFSFSRLMAHAADVSNRCVVPVEPKRPLWYKIISPLYYTICAPFQTIEAIVGGTDNNQWHRPSSKLSRVVRFAISNRITFEYLKEIKNFYKVNVTALILAAAAGGIRKYMLKHGIKIPNALHCATAQPMQGHPSHKLRNYMTAIFVKLPLGKTDPVERVKSIHQHLDNYKFSTVPRSFFSIVPFIGGMIAPMVKSQAQNNMTTAILSNFPGPHSPTNFLDLPIIDMQFASGLLLGTTGIILTALSYMGGLKILVEVDKDLIATDKGVEELMQYIMEELDILKHAGKV